LIRIRVRGAWLDMPGGDLRLVGLPGASIQLHAPVAYQETEEHPRRVESHFFPHGQNEIAFSVSRFAPAIPLVIPVLT
jgi:hypothetical protein